MGSILFCNIGADAELEFHDDVVFKSSDFLDEFSDKHEAGIKFVALIIKNARGGTIIPPRAIFIISFILYAI
jgi:hypothetical protein